MVPGNAAAEGEAEPNGRDWDTLSRLAWPADHPYHHPVIGTIADIRGFTTIACGHSCSAWRPPIAVRTPQAFAS